MPKYQDVEPFKNGKKMRIFENELLKHGSRPREIYVAWQLGKCCLLRVSDVIKLRYHQIYNDKGKVNNTVVTHDQKTKKYNPLNLEPLKQILEDYRNWRIVNHIRSEWLLPATTDSTKHVNRKVIYYLIKLSAGLHGFKHIRCHSARKTGAYILYKNTNNLAMVSRMLNHSSERITERYLGINDPAIRSATNGTNWEDIPRD